MLHPDDREPTRTFWTDSVAGHGPYDVEYRVRRSDGEYRWFKTRGVPIRDDAGNICKWFGTCTDISDLRQTEEALRESEERFRGTFENAAVGIAHRDATGRFLCVNEKFCAIVGYSREELLQKNIQDITHPNDLSVTIDAFTALWQGESPTLGLEKHYVRKDGSLVWIGLFASLQRDAAGKPAYDISIVNDISEHKQLEEQLRASEERQRLILDNAHDAFVAMSADGLIAEWNRQAEITFGWPRAEAVGRVLSGTIIPPQFREAHSRGLARFLATAEGPLLNRVLDVQALRRDGSEFPAEISIAPVRLGEHYLFVAFIRDVTERKRAEEEVRRAKEAAETANRAKDEFLANVSHEIRTPMNAILGMTELVLDAPLADDQRQCLKTVKSAADNLLGILNDLLDFSKIEAGKLELDHTDFSLRAAVGDTLHALALRTHKKGLELIYQVNPDVADALVGDASRLRQVLLNLVGNAIKFTEEGEVVVRVEAAGSPAPEDQVGLHFVVSDTGIGISPERQERIFGAFEQEDASTTRRYGGTGLGLTIAARLVDIMGGKITVDSRPGRGSTFSFTAWFGRQPPGSEPVAARPPAQLRDMRVLIVDDNATNRRILEEWLRSWRMEPVAVGDGLAALNALWRALSLGRPYALVLLDARMPDTDGLALTAQLRAGRVGRHADHPPDLGGPSRGPGPVARAAGRSPSVQAGPAGRTARGDLPGDEPRRRRSGGGSAHASSGIHPGAGRGAAADPGGRGQRVQPTAPGGAADPPGLQGAAGGQRPGGAGPDRDQGPGVRGHSVPDSWPHSGDSRPRLRFADPGVRPATPGPPDARARWTPGRPSDPGTGAGRGGTFARNRPDGSVTERRPRALPRGGDGRLPRQARPFRGAVRGHGAGGFLSEGSPAHPARCRRRHQSARSGRLVRGLRRRRAGAVPDVRRPAIVSAGPTGRGG